MVRCGTAKREAPAFSAHQVLKRIASDLTRIRLDDDLTFSDIGAVLGKSEDQAAKYCYGTATMDAVAYARGRKEWGNRFTGSLDALFSSECARHTVSDQDRQTEILQAALVVSAAQSAGKSITNAVSKQRAVLLAARDAIDELLARAAS